MKISTVLLALCGMASAASAQSLLGEGGGSPYDPPKRTPFKKRDHIQILVQEKSKALSSTELKTDRRSRFDVEIEDWIRFSDTGNGTLPRLRAAALPGDPGIGLDGRYRNDNQGRTTRQFDLSFVIASEVVDVRPNGVLVLQAIKRRKVNDDEELIRLTGEVSPDAVILNKVRSDSVVNLNITYDGSGSVSDTAKPGFLGWVLSKLWPF